MGAAESSAESVVNQCFSEAFLVTDAAIGKASPAATQEERIEIDNCEIRIPGGIVMTQMARMDMAATATNLSNIGIDADIQNKVTQLLKSEAVTGIGWADSHAQFISDVALKIAMTISTEAKALAEGLVAQVQVVSITNCKGLADIAFIRMEQLEDIKATAFSKNTSTTALKAELINEMDNQGISKAKGFDPTWIIIAIVIVIVIMVFGGFDIIASNVLKPSVWFMISIAVAAWGIWDLVKGFTHNTILPNDTPEIVEKKKGWHSSDKKWGWILCGVGGIAALITGFIFVKNSKK
jgi:hypothetical protein